MDLPALEAEVIGTRSVIDRLIAYRQGRMTPEEAKQFEEYMDKTGQWESK